MLDLCEGSFIDKARHEIRDGDLVWQIDVFHGANQGLVVAEVELEREDQPFATPAWLGLEVTQDQRYQNSHLAARPYSTWPQEDAAEATLASA